MIANSRIFLIAMACLISLKAHTISGFGSQTLSQNDPMSDTAVLVVLDLKTMAICSGTLISPDLVLTAAHCLKYLFEREGEMIPYSLPTEKLHIHFGGFKAKSLETGNIFDRRWVSVVDYKVHPSFQPSIDNLVPNEDLVSGCTKNDIALIKISLSDGMSLQPKPAKLLKPTNVIDKDFQTAKLYGLGLKGPEGTLNQLNTIERASGVFPKDEFGQCLRVQWPDNPQQAGPDGKYMGLQIGDSGGTALLEVDGADYLAGVNSGPSAYGFIPFFYDWIMTAGEEMNAILPK